MEEKKNKKEKLKRKFKNTKQQGITLIALVVTIIILLILAGVSIAMLTGNNGILTQAQKAKEETENASGSETADLANFESLINQYQSNIKIEQVTDEKPGELEKENDTTFVINSIEDLVFFSYDVTTNGNKYANQIVKLGTNLDFNSDKSYVDPNRIDFAGYNGTLKQALISENGFKPIGDLIEGGTNYFYGTFDGNDKAICSLYININSSEDINAGLFSTNYGEVKNLVLSNANLIVKGKMAFVGGIDGRAHNNINNCYITGNLNVTGTSWTAVGGVVGEFHGSANIENCYNLSNIVCKNVKEGYGDANISCGGIAGQIQDGEINIEKCFNKGDITVDGGNNDINVAGICGGTNNNGEIKNCYNIGNIEGHSLQNAGMIGGIIGKLNKMDILYCYNTGDITVSEKYLYVGGIVGNQGNNTTIINVFNIGKITIKNAYMAANTGGIVGYGNYQYETEIANFNINNAYNIGTINIENANNKIVGSISGNGNITFNNCYYLKGTYDVGGTVTGITELDSINEFPSVLEVVNGDEAFKEDTNNINNGYPILNWQ